MPQTTRQLSQRIRETKPAGYSFLIRKCSEQERLRIMRYLTACRSGVIEDLGGEQALSTQKIILIDRLISMLGVVRAVEEHFKDDIMSPDGNLKPALQSSYLAYTNSCRLILCSLGLEKQTNSHLTVIEQIAAIDAEKEEKNSDSKAA